MEGEGEGEFEEESDVRTENRHLFPDGTELQSSTSQFRVEELNKRKDEVIAILNDTYEEGENETDPSQSTTNLDTPFESDQQVILEQDYFHDEEVSVKLKASNQEFNEVIDLGQA